MKRWLLWIIFLYIYCISIVGPFRCQSCFAGCLNFDDCDCEGDSNSICHAPYCYAKLEYFSEDGISAVQKGCTNHVSTNILGCQYASDDRSIACFCSGDLCNSAANLSTNQSPKLPVLNCCECNEDERDEDGTDHGCCRRNCTGNYCYMDLVANARGCGWGHPQLFHFLRTPKYGRWPDELTCAEYYDNNKNYMSGCTCSKDYCNSVQDLNTVKPRHEDQNNSHFCYSLYHQSETVFGDEVYRRASLCRSPFCFVSWSSVEVASDADDVNEDYDYEKGGSGEKDHNGDSDTRLAYLPTLRPMFEISAGCVHVDHEDKVHLGCTMEWSGSRTMPLTRHCICADKLCNDYHLIGGTNGLHQTPSTPTPSTRPSTAARTSSTDPPALHARAKPALAETTGRTSIRPAETSRPVSTRPTTSPATPSSAPAATPMGPTDAPVHLETVHGRPMDNETKETAENGTSVLSGVEHLTRTADEDGNDSLSTWVPSTVIDQDTAPSIGPTTPPSESPPSTPTITASTSSPSYPPTTAGQNTCVILRLVVFVCVFVVFLALSRF